MPDLTKDSLLHHIATGEIDRGARKRLKDIGARHRNMAERCKFQGSHDGHMHKVKHLLSGLGRSRFQPAYPARHGCRSRKESDRAHHGGCSDTPLNIRIPDTLRKERAEARVARLQEERIVHESVGNEQRRKNDSTK